MKALFRIIHLILALSSTPALADDRIRIEIGPPNRAVEVISPTFFDPRPQYEPVVMNRYGYPRYEGEPTSTPTQPREKSDQPK
ncbi:MAG: hypothetical protein HYR96_15255 [Deltaproteobacteria bacterium]|nr:hypothetical protein [Deltaproteobacteria bacterium]MBI3296249.1 hypothetical protein [Deltaproteobacteria bacterium]